MPTSSRLLSRFRGHAETDRVAVHDGHGGHTYAALLARSQQIAQTLRAGTDRDGLAGERVALLVAPSAEFVSAFFGVLLAGGCVVVLTPLHTAAESTYVCDDAAIRTVLCSRALAERAKELGARTRLVVEEIADAPLDAAGEPPIACTRASAALQLYTSGTTGRPKGAVLTHDNLAVQQDLLAAAWGLTPDDELLHTLPLHHMHGLCIALMAALGAGAATRLLPTFDAATVWEGMAECSVFMGVPTIYAKLFAALDAADPATRARWGSCARSLRLATSGSSALPVTLGDRWRALTGEYPLERFGMTEVGVGLTNPLSGERRPGSVGMPLPTVETRIVGEAGDDAKPGEAGELWIAGPSVFAEYWGRAEATAAAFTEVAGTRWFRTGDTVVREADGYVRILGRTSVDILKSGGYKLSALEIEEVLREHPAIAEVAVIGVPDATWGERVVACVVARPDQDDACDEAALRAFAKEKLAAYKVPKNVVRFAELPRNAMGKVLKPELARAVAARGLA